MATITSRLRWLRPVLAVGALLALAGCYVAPGGYYYGAPGYPAYAAAYPAYPGYYAAAPVVVGGGWGWGCCWRRWR